MYFNVIFIFTYFLLESGFLPKELLLEEKRLQEELRIKDEEAKVIIFKKKILTT